MIRYMCTLAPAKYIAASKYCIMEMRLLELHNFVSRWPERCPDAATSRPQILRRFSQRFCYQKLGGFYFLHRRSIEIDHFHFASVWHCVCYRKSRFTCNYHLAVCLFILQILRSVVESFCKHYWTSRSVVEVLLEILLEPGKGNLKVREGRSMSNLDIFELPFYGFVNPSKFLKIVHLM